MKSGFDMNKDLTAGRGADTILSVAFCQRHIGIKNSPKISERLPCSEI